MKKTTRQKILLLQIFLCIIMGLYIYIKISNKVRYVDCSDVGMPVMAKWYPASEKFSMGTPIELILSLINTSKVDCVVQYYKFDMPQIDFPSCKVNSKPCKRILEPIVGSWDGFVPTVHLVAGESEGIPLYLNNYWALDQTGTYQVTCVIKSVSCIANKVTFDECIQDARMPQNEKGDAGHRRYILWYWGGGRYSPCGLVSFGI